MDEQIRKVLTELDDAIRRSMADGRIDEQEKAELRALVEQVETTLAEPEEDHEGVVDRLESAAVRFEVDHPTVAAVLRSAANTLSAAGI